MSQRRNTTMQPAAKRISKGSTPSSAAAAAAIPVTARNLVFTAVRPKPQSACKTTAIITGLAPYSTPTACGSIPNRRYATAIVVTRIAAGRMNEIPATRRPAPPARSKPMYNAISVELGPGRRLTAPSKSRNFSRESHPRRRTSSSSIKAMWPAGPPKEITPRRRNTAVSSPSRCPPRCVASSSIWVRSGITPHCVRRQLPTRLGSPPGGWRFRLADTSRQ